MTKKAVFIFVLFLSFCFAKQAQAQQMSAGTTYKTEVDDSWYKINTGTWMGETWFSLQSSNYPDVWTQLEWEEGTDGEIILILPNTSEKMFLRFINEDQLELTFESVDDVMIFDVIERYGEPVKR